MLILVRIVVGMLLLAHGLVHLLYLARDVPEFTLDHSWLVPDAARRPVGLVLMARHGRRVHAGGLGGVGGAGPVRGLARADHRGLRALRRAARAVLEHQPGLRSGH